MVVLFSVSWVEVMRWFSIVWIVVFSVVLLNINLCGCDSISVWRCGCVRVKWMDVVKFCFSFVFFFVFRSVDRRLLKFFVVILVNRWL